MARELALPTRAFVLGLADDAGALDAAAVYDAADAVGFTTTRTRLALRRLVEDGCLSIEGRGRAATLQLTHAGLAERKTDLTWVAAAHRLDAQIDHWDGTWHLVTFEIPEEFRAARDAIRNALIDLLAAPLGGGLYLSPWPLEPWIAPHASVLNVADRVSHISASSISVNGSRDPQEIAASLWPVEELATRYAAFVGRWSDAAPIADTGAAVRAAFGASAEIEALLRIDPVLPSEALPMDFAGPTARQTYRDLLHRLRRDHPLLDRANIFGAYDAAISVALDQTSSEFWAAATAAGR